MNVLLPRNMARKFPMENLVSLRNTIQDSLKELSALGTKIDDERLAIEVLRLHGMKMAVDKIIEAKTTGDYSFFDDDDLTPEPRFLNE